jgi:hypothetical protein
MTELTQPTHRERTANAGGLGGLFDDQHEPNGLVTVAVGPYVERLPLGNSSVAQIRARFGLRFDIDPRTQAVLDGHEVGDDTVVRTGQVLMFVHKSGEKGCLKVQGPRSRISECGRPRPQNRPHSLALEKSRSRFDRADFLRPRTGALPQRRSACSSLGPWTSDLGPFSREAAHG